MSDYETKATSWEPWRGGVAGAPSDPVRPKGGGWRLVRVVPSAGEIIGYWERKVSP